jgi:acylphosphatase
MIARHLVIHGRVQGVYYRGWSVETARGLGLSGWVRNRRDGSVEMLIAGPEGEVEAMIARCRHGPAAAQVDHVDVTDSDDISTDGFESWPTL